MFNFPQTEFDKAKECGVIIPPFCDLLKSHLFATLAYYEPPEFEKAFNVLCPEEFNSLFRDSLDVAFMLYIDAGQITDHGGGRGQDTQCFVWCKNNTVFMTFRGTNGFSDVLTDLDILTLGFGEHVGVRVHKGFLEQFQAVRPSLTNFLKDREGEYNHIVITGHSLGGALATIAGAHFSHLYLGVEVAVHTFGSPRVGNKAFGKYFNEHVAEHWRVVNEEDPAPLVPASWRFSHVPGGNVLTLDEECPGRYSVGTGDAEWYMRCGVTFTTLDWCSLAKPHSTAMYMSNLHALAATKACV